MAITLLIINSISSQTTDPIAVEADKLLNSMKPEPVIWKPPCEGICWNVPMDFANNSLTYPWSPSHGTPTISPNSIWLWSTQNFGEGVNLDYNFINGKRYCIESTMKLAINQTTANVSTATINIKLSQTQVNGSPSFLLPIVTPTQSVRNSFFTSLYPPTTSQTLIDNFTAGGNYGNIWFYPLNPLVGHISMQLTAVKICLNEPCQSLKITFKYKQICSSFYFYPYVFGLASGFNVVGYLWEFGDGTTSNLPFPNHVYASPGFYQVTLTVYTKNSKTGECCSKKISWKVEAKKCDPCELLISSLSVITTNQGGQIMYEPNLPHIPNYLYNWNFLGLSPITNRVVYMNSYQSGSLTIYFAGDNNKCCEMTVKFGGKIFEQIDVLDSQEVTFSN